MSEAVAVRIGGGAGGGRDGRDRGGAPREESRAPRPPQRRVRREDMPAEAGGPSPPRPILMAAGVFALVTIIGAGIARRTGAGHVEVPRAAVSAARDLWFDDAPGGEVRVRTRTAAGADSVVTTLHAGEGMFVRGALRALARERRIDAPASAAEPGADATTSAGEAHAPFRLTRYVDGRLTLDDSSTGAHLELRAFGPTNAAAFAALLPPAVPTTTPAPPAPATPTH